MPRHQTLLLALALLLFALLFQGARGLWDPDEGRYVAAALEMQRSGNYRDIALHPEIPHFTKPPLAYWTLVASFAALGESELVARLPSALAFWGSGLLLLSVGGMLTPAAPWAPALVYATSTLPFVAAHVVNTDTLLAFFELLAVWGFLKHWHAGSRRSSLGFRIVMWAGFGLAFLTKGPPGLLPLLAIVPFTWRVRGGREALALLSPPGLVAFAVIGLGWYAAVVRAHPELLRSFVVEELVGRAAGVHGRNPEWYMAFAVYVPTLLLGSLPWWRPLGKMIRPGPSQPHDPLDTFLWLWILLPLLVFLLARSRLPFYVLPLFAPLSLLLARAAPRLGSRWRQELVATASVWACLLLGLKLASGQVAFEGDSRAMAQALRAQVPSGYREVVSVDDFPRLGLGFYLGVPVEPIRLNDRSLDSSPRTPQWLADELREPAPLESRVFVVEESGLRAFGIVAGAARLHVREHGGWREFRFLTVEPRRRPPGRSGTR